MEAAAAVETSALPENTLTVQSLKAIIKKANQEAADSNPKSKKPQHVQQAGAVPTAWFFVSRDLGMMAPCNPYDEVFPGIYLGDEGFARNKDTLKSVGITHLINSAEGKKFNQIDSSSAYYGDLKLQYLGINGQDVMGYKMNRHFRTASEFIHNCLQNEGKVAVHCHMGRSRSATLVLAYLMIHHSLPLTEALRTVCLKRAISPNDGFLRQLIELELELRPKETSTQTPINKQ